MLGTSEDIDVAFWRLDLVPPLTKPAVATFVRVAAADLDATRDVGLTMALRPLVAATGFV